MNKYFVATVLSFVIVLGAIRSFHIYQIAASTPSQAVSKYISFITKNSPMEGEKITAVSTEPMSESQNALAVLFRATMQDQNLSMVGYAVTKKSIWGWYVESSQTFGESAQLDNLIAKLDQYDERPVIYGQVFLTNAARVEASFSNLGESTVDSDITDGCFVLIGSRHQDLMEFRILDPDGRVIKRLTKDELQNE
jgi:hypothetical protein